MPVFTPEKAKKGKTADGEDAVDGELLSKLQARNKELEREVEKVKKKARKGSKSERKEIESLKAKNERSEELLKKTKEELKALKKKKGKKINKEVADKTAANRRENKELKIQNDDLTKQAGESQKTVEHLRNKLKDAEDRLAIFETYKTDVDGKDVRKLRDDLRDADNLKDEWEEEMKNQESTAERRVQKAQGLLAEFQKTNKELRSHNGYLQMRVQKLEERASSGDGRRLEQLEDWNQESRRLLAAKTRRIKELETQFGVSATPVPGGRPHVYEDDYEGRFNAPPVREQPDRGTGNVGYGGPRGSPGRGSYGDRGDNAMPRRRVPERGDDRRGYEDEERRPTATDAYSKYGAPRPKAYQGGTYQQKRQKALSDSGSEEEPARKERRPQRKPRRRESSASESESESESERRPKRKSRKKKRRVSSSSSSGESESDSRRGPPRRRKPAETESEHEYDDVIEIVEPNGSSKKAANGKDEFQPKSILKKNKPPTEPEEEPVIKMWKKYTDPKGRPYYHDHVTGKTCWTRPSDFRI